MTATVGASLSGVTFPDRHAGLGPFKSAAGNIYFFGRDSTNVGHMEPHKATDPTSSFTAQTTKLMSSANGTSIEAASCYQVSDVIHVVAQISTGAVYYNQFNMATDAWSITTSETAVSAASFAPTANYTFVSLVVRSNGNVVIGYCAGLTAMSSGFNMVRYRERTGTNTYGTATNVDNGGSINWSGGVAVLGASDRVHFFLKDNTNADPFQRTLTAANALQTWPSTFDATVSGTNVLIFAPVAGVYVSSGTTKVRMPYWGNSYVAYFDSGDAPSVSSTNPTLNPVDSGNPPLQANSVWIDYVVANGSNFYSLWSRNSDQDLLRDSSTDGGLTWGTDVNELTGTINRVTANVYERGAGTQLAMVVDDGGTLKYAEIKVSAGAPFPTDAIQRMLMRR